MIRLIFDNGEIADCEHIQKIYIEEYEMDKAIVVGRISDEQWDDDKRDEAVPDGSVSGQDAMAREGSEYVNKESCSDIQEHD